MGVLEVSATGGVIGDPFGVYRAVMCGDIVILMQAVDPALCRRARDAVFAWGGSTPPQLESPLKIRANAHLASYLPPRSMSRYIFHSYEFYLAQADGEPDVTKIVRPVFERLRAIYQLLTGDTHWYLSADDGFVLLPQCIQYPQGGGFFEEHFHSLKPQQIGLILAASEHGKDYEVGGVRFRENAHDTWVETEGRHHIGDVCLFRYDLFHDITPVDPHVPLDWSKNTGRWSFVLPLKPVPKS